ncbi:MAG: hypothetical protein IJF71_00745 [Clostridia bacterium]|nr:hypothetical protein [Clostridia bacterium]
MKKVCSIAVLLLMAALCVMPLVQVNRAEAAVYTATDYAALKDAFTKANATGEATTVYISGEITVESTISLKGNVTLIGDGGAVLVMNSATQKTGFELKKNSSLTVKNATVRRTVADETERFVFYTYETNVTLSFEEVVFDIKTLEIASVNYDRVTYCSTANAMTLYVNGCSFLTEAYFYRGLMIFYNCDSLPQRGGSPTVKDFSALKIDYTTGKLTFPADITVSTEEDFSSLVKSGAEIASQTEYFVQKDGFSFSFVSKNLKCATPTAASLVVDYQNETVSYAEEYRVSKKSDFSEVFQSGSKIAPGDVLYVQQKGEGIFRDSDVFVMTFPQREPSIEVTCAFVCEFGFALEHQKGMEYKVFESYQDAPVFVGLESGETYTVTARAKATANAFCSEEFTFTVTTK